MSTLLGLVAGASFGTGLLMAMILAIDISEERTPRNSPRLLWTVVLFLFNMALAGAAFARAVELAVSR